jgi:hypothetical protein
MFLFFGCTCFFKHTKLKMCVIVFARSLAVTFCTKSVVVLLPRVFIGFGIYVNVTDCRVIYAFKFWIGALIVYFFNRKEETKLLSFNIGRVIKVCLRKHL